MATPNIASKQISPVNPHQRAIFQSNLHWADPSRGNRANHSKYAGGERACNGCRSEQLTDNGCGAGKFGARMARLPLSLLRLFSLDPSDQRASWRQITLLIAAIAILTAFFWTQSRYPQLNDKQLMGARALIDALAFDTITVAKSGDGFVRRVGINTLNWYYTNAKGMAFGVLLASLFLALLSLVSFVSSRSVFINTLAGLFIGAPLGICTNCVAPISKSLREGGGRLETALATQLSSPTLNVIVVAMLFSLIPLPLVLLKMALTLALILLVVPLLTSRVFVSENAERATGDISCQIATPWPEQSWREAAQSAALVTIRSLGFVVRTTLPLMLLAGLLGGAVMEVVPLGALADLEFSVGGALIVGALGTFLPVPIAFDIIFVNIMLAAGLDASYCMIFLFTLAPFSIYPFMLLWRAFSPRVVTLLTICVFGIGVFSGMALYAYERNTVAEDLEVLAEAGEVPDAREIAELIIAGCAQHRSTTLRSWCERTHLSQSAQRLGDRIPCDSLSDAEKRAACRRDVPVDCEVLEGKEQGLCFENMALSEAESRVAGLKRVCASSEETGLTAHCERLLPYQHAIFGRPEECLALGEPLRGRCRDFHTLREARATNDPKLCDNVFDIKTRLRCLVATRAELAACEALSPERAQECRLRLALTHSRETQTPGERCTNLDSEVAEACRVEFSLIAQLHSAWRSQSLGMARISLSLPHEELRSRQPPAQPPAAIHLTTTQLWESGSVRLSGEPRTPRGKTSRAAFARVDLAELGIRSPEFRPSDVLAHYLRFGLGLAAGDYDRDGWVDVVLATRHGPVLYRNLGALRFSEVPISLADEAHKLEQSTVNVALVDIDNDGYLDLYMAGVGEPGRFILNRDGGFDAARVIELPSPIARLIGYSATFSDVDRDGLLDVFTGYWTSQSPPRVDDASENRLFMNRGGKFDIHAYRDPYRGSTMSTLFSDLNRDGFTDLLVGNDWETPDEILFGQADGLLRARADTSPIPYTPTFSMGYDTGDLNNDGRFDLIAIEADFHAAEGPQDICHAIEGFGERLRCEEVVRLSRSIRSGDAQGCAKASDATLKADCESGVLAKLAIRLNRPALCAKIPADAIRTFCEFEVRRRARTFVLRNSDIPQRHHNMLFLQSSSGAFEDVSERWGVQLSYWSWNSKLQDLDNDGWLDLLVANGTFERVSPNLHFRNVEGTRFEQLDTLLHESISSSAYLAEDFDNDGDLDILINGIAAPYRFFRNDSANEGLIIRVRDRVGNSHAIGAIVSIETSGSAPKQVRELKLGGGFLSFASSSAHFGVGQEREVDAIEIVWPDGALTRIDGPWPVDQIYTLERLGDAPGSGDGAERF